MILIGLAGTALSSLVFGFATNFWVALGARVIGGLLNGNVAVMQTMVAEMCKKPEWERKWTKPYLIVTGVIDFGSSQSVRHAAFYVVAWNDYRSCNGRLSGTTCPLLSLGIPSRRSLWQIPLPSSQPRCRRVHLSGNHPRIPFPRGDEPKVPISISTYRR